MIDRVIPIEEAKKIVDTFGFAYDYVICMRPYGILANDAAEYFYECERIVSKSKFKNFDEIMNDSSMEDKVEWEMDFIDLLDALKNRKMSSSEFYEKYWRVHSPDGTISTPVLTNINKAFLEMMDEYNEILEGNKLIDSFMNLPQNNFGYAIPNTDGETTFYAEEMKYHSDWTWLMAVVEKIERLDCVSEIKIFRNCCEIYPDMVHDFMVDTIDSTKILATFFAVVNFIKWFNQNK